MSGCVYQMWYALSDYRRVDVNMYMVCTRGQWKTNFRVSLTINDTGGRCLSQWPKQEFGHRDALKLTQKPNLSIPCAKTCDACAHARLTNIKSCLTSTGSTAASIDAWTRQALLTKTAGLPENLGCPTASGTQNNNEYENIVCIVAM